MVAVADDAPDPAPDNDDDVVLLKCRHPVADYRLWKPPTQRPLLPASNATCAPVPSAGRAMKCIELNVWVVKSATSYQSSLSLHSLPLNGQQL